MPKKTAKPKTTKRSSTKRTHVKPLVSVMDKTVSVELKRALRRRENRRTHTELIDHSVPQDVLFQGVLNTYTHEHKPTIEKGTHAFSPFVLSLKAPLPSPEEILDGVMIPTPSINLLNTSVLAKRISTKDTSNDLELSCDELTSQLVEETIQRQDWSPWSLPLAPRLRIPSFLSLKAKPLHQALKYKAGAFETFSSDVFVPHEIPEDIFAYFDFPEDETEKEDEAELLELEDLTPEESLPSPSHSGSWKFAFPSWHLPTLGVGWQRAIASFVAISFLFVLPLHAMNIVQDLRLAKADLEQTGGQAVSLLSSGAQAALLRDAPQADSDFQNATEQFQHAQNTIDQLGAGTDFLLSALPTTQSSFASGQALIEAGQALSIAGGRISAGYAAMESELSPTPISRLNILEAYLSSTIPHLETAQQALERVDLEIVPEQYRSTLSQTQLALPTLIQSVHEFEALYDVARALLGADGTKRYLIVFQNNTEIRPTGGFIGSFAEVKMHDGVIENLHVPGGGSYDLQGTLKHNLAAPDPLQLLKERWEFQDGNWFPDFPTSARQLMQFYEDAGGPSVDGVLAVNATYISELIGMLGSIDMPEYGRVINEENFMFEAQQIVELEYDKEENAPKAFIGDLAPILVERTIEKTSEDFLGVIDYVNRGLSEKSIQLYLADESLERKIIEQGWGGEVKWTNGDYLMVVDTNLGGGKTDGVIEQNVKLNVDIASDGSITNTLTISRTHYGIQGVLFTGVNNVDYLRVYVPKGSTLLESSGFSIPDQSLFEIPDDSFEIDDDLLYTLMTQQIDPISGTTITEEHGKSVFGNWVQTKPGTTSTVTFRYKLPFKLETLAEDTTSLMSDIKSFIGIPNIEEYTLTIQKQSGILDRTTDVYVTTPPSLNPIWSSR